MLTQFFFHQFGFVAFFYVFIFLQKWRLLLFTEFLLSIHKRCWVCNLVSKKMCRMCLGGSKLIKTKIIIKKYVKYLKRSYPKEFADSTKNHNKMAGIPIRKFSKKKNYFKNESELKIRIVVTRRNFQV
jgi:hypothetical protein